MAYNAKLIESRPITTVEFYHPSDEIIAKLEEFKTAGKIVSYTLNETDGDFNRTDTVVWSSEAEHAAGIADSVLAGSAVARATHCTNNGISTSLEIGN